MQLLLSSTVTIYKITNISWELLTQVYFGSLPFSPEVMVVMQKRVRHASGYLRMRNKFSKQNLMVAL